MNFSNINSLDELIKQAADAADPAKAETAPAESSPAEATPAETPSAESEPAPSSDKKAEQGTAKQEIIDRCLVVLKEMLSIGNSIDSYNMQYKGDIANASKIHSAIENIADFIQRKK